MRKCSLPLKETETRKGKYNIGSVIGISVKSHISASASLVHVHLIFNSFSCNMDSEQFVVVNFELVHCDSDCSEAFKYCYRLSSSLPTRSNPILRLIIHIILIVAIIQCHIISYWISCWYLHFSMVCMSLESRKFNMNTCLSSRKELVF